MLIRIIVGLVLIPAARAGDFRIEATMVTEPHGRELNTYVPDARNLYATFKAKGTKEGDNIRCVWIADDVGDAAPKETKIDERALSAKGDMDGEFSLSRPTTGWPLVKYHIDIYVNDELATKVPFEIKAAGTSKKDKDQDKDEDEEESGD
jgi:hypothetical protein